jgi:ribosomal protein S8
MINTLGIINRGIKEKKKSVTVPYTDTSMKIIQILHCEGYLLSYIVIYNSIHLEINNYENSAIINKLKFYNHLHLGRCVTLKQLKSLVFLKNKRLLVSTCYGILTGEVALKYLVGGTILVEIT